MIDEALIKSLLEDGYSHLAEREGRGIVGIQRFVFTTSIVYGIDEIGYVGRYCYSSQLDAVTSLYLWDGKGDPPGDWIKHKGRIEYPNPKNFKPND